MVIAIILLVTFCILFAVRWKSEDVEVQRECEFWCNAIIGITVILLIVFPFITQSIVHYTAYQDVILERKNLISQVEAVKRDKENGLNSELDTVKVKCKIKEFNHHLKQVRKLAVEPIYMGLLVPNDYLDIEYISCNL